MLESLDFTFNGLSSKEMGVVIVNDGGLYKENFLPNRKLVTTKIAGNPTPFFQRVEEEAVPFSLNLYIKDWKDRNNLRTIARWLYSDYYAPLTFESNSDLIVYGMFVNKSELNHNGLKQGYVTLEFQPRDPFIYSIPHKLTFDVNKTLTKKIYNHGDLPLLFKLTFENRTRGDINIYADEGDYSESFELLDIFEGETVWVDCKREYIVSSLEERLVRYLGDNHNDVWLRIPPATDTTVVFNGDYKITMEYQYRYLTFDNELAYT